MSSLRQDIQVRPSTTFLDNLAAGSTLESASANLEDDLNGSRSQQNRIIDATGAGSWFDAIPTVNTKQRGLLQLNTDLDDIEEHKILCNANILTAAMSVAASENWLILSVAGSEAPSQVAAEALTQIGAVVAQSAFSAGAFAANELVEIAGSDATNPKNLVSVRDASTGQPIQSSGRDVFGLLQYESTGTDGAAFNDTSAGNRVKISFVRLTATFDDLEACPVADIESTSIHYNYLFRATYDTLPEDCAMATRSFIDQSASVDVTRQNAYTNQGTTAVELATNADLDLAAAIAWGIRDATDADLLLITEGSGGGTSTVQIGAAVDTFDVDAIVNNFAAGISANSGGTRPINVGVTDGIVESTAGDLELQAAGEMLLDDGNRGASTFSVPMKVTETAAEWSALDTAFGEVSLAAMLVAAFNSSNTRKEQATVTSTTAGSNDISGPANDNNIDINLGDLSGGTFADDYDFFFNGALVPHTGVGGANTPVVSAGTALANGQIQFNFTVRATPANNPDTITMFARA